MQQKNKYILVVAMLLWVFTNSMIAQTAPQNNQPKIGLVLSGGGAKGLAHIGALKVIDSLGIKIDYVGGTSMGAIVGGLYAAGYTGKQLDSIARVTDFDLLINDIIPRSSRSYFERIESERYAVTLPFKDFKINLPTSLSKGQNFYNFTNKLLTPVDSINDFSKLPIPFFCIATNIVSGEEVILDSGHLPKILSASGALPSLFAPVTLNGLYLIDGGVTNNYPVEHLKSLGMDIIIGVDVQDDLKSLEEIQSALDVLTQINNYRTIEAMKQKSALTTIYITPDINDFTVVSFNKKNEIINQGRIAANDNLTKLKQLGSDYTKPSLKIQSQSDSIQIYNLAINGNDNYSRAYIKGRFDFDIPGKATYDQIKTGINNLQATDNFTKIDYQLVQDRNGYRLDLDVVEIHVRNFLKFGLHYDELLRSAALINLTRKRVLFDNDVLSGEVILGDNIRYNLDYYLDKGKYWSVGVHSEFIQFDKLVNANFVDTTPNAGINALDINYNDWTNQLFFQTKLPGSMYVTLGLEHKNLRVFTRTLITGNPDDNRTIFEDSNIGSLYGKVQLDHFNKPYFPNEGWKLAGDFHFYALSSDYTNSFNEFSIAQLEVAKAFPLMHKLTLRAQGFIGLPIGEPTNNSLDFFLGGYGARRVNNTFSFYGYDFLSAGGDSVLSSLVEVDWELFKKNHIIISANLANIDDNLFGQSEWFKKARYTGYGIGYGLETFLGPVEVKYSFSPQQSASQIFVKVGFAF